jgi:hypothetical protein
MKNIYNKFLIISTILLFIGGVYLYLSKDLNSETLVPVALGSSLESSNVTTPVDTSKENIDSNISFLTKLASLKKINIDTALFKNLAFNALKNNSVKIEKVPAGRVNPFAPTVDDSIDTSQILSNVVTNQPTQVTDKTAILNGTLNTTNNVTDLYFEYGNKIELGTTSEKIKQSLVGTFVKNISGLIPKTTYFFKACAKINNIASCGEVISFTTN